MTKGFTLLELLLVISGIVIIAVFTMPIGINFYNAQSFDETASGILSNLRRAQNQAFFQKNDSDYGVKFLANSYVFFRGSSYALRATSDDEIFYLPSGISIAGDDEIVFKKFTGRPAFAASFGVVSLDSISQININEEGLSTMQ